MYVLALVAVIVVSIILLATAVTMRSTTEGRWVVQLADIGIALVPIFVWLVLTGQLAKRLIPLHPGTQNVVVMWVSSW